MRARPWMLITLIGLAGGAEAAHAQSATPPSLDPEMVAFFSGAWGCAGQFASGRAIEADMSFTPVLEGRWLQHSHMDRAPNRYQAISMWGTDADGGESVSQLHDNFGTARRFASTGWNDRTIVFERAQLATEPARRERFTYRAEADDAFRMEYHVTPNGRDWRMVDFLVCRRS